MWVLTGRDGAGGAHPADSDSAAGAWTAGYPQKETAPGGKIWGGLNLGRTGKASAQGATPGGAHPAVLRRTRMPVRAHPTACLPAPGAPELARSDARQSPSAPSTPRGLLDSRRKPPCQCAHCAGRPCARSVARCLVTGPSDDGYASAALILQRQSESQRRSGAGAGLYPGLAIRCCGSGNRVGREEIAVDRGGRDEEFPLGASEWEHLLHWSVAPFDVRSRSLGSGQEWSSSFGGKCSYGHLSKR